MEPNINEFEGIEYIASTKRFAAYTNKWPPFDKRKFLGTFATLDEAVNARRVALTTRNNRHKTYETAII